ncbi:MAG: DUF3073 domain-containing protein [Candidatus Nanopelagicales bacterium]|jgi:hypothetical protein
MGRGRAKAKQTKVARALKYGGPQTDLERLQAELAGGGSTSDASTSDDELEDDPYAEEIYAKYLDDED